MVLVRAEGAAGGGSTGDGTGGAGGTAAVRAVILDIIREHGISLADDPRRVEAFLADLCGEHPAEIAVAVTVLREGLLDELARPAATPSQPASLVLPRLAARLHERHGADLRLALWAVGTWALALGLASAEEVRALDSSPASATPSGPVSDPAAAGWHAPGAPGARVLPTETGAWGPATITAGPATTPPGGPGLPLASPARARTRSLVLVVVVAVAVVAAAAGAGVVALSGGGTKPRSAPPATTGASTGETGSKGAPPSLSHPPLGTYSYATTIVGGSSPGSSVSTVQIEQVGSEVGVAFTGFGEKYVESDLYEWGPAQVKETSTEYLDSSMTPISKACVWSPRFLTLAEPLRSGASWSNDSTCTLTTSSGSATIEIQSSDSVLGTRNVSVPLGSLPAALVDVTETVTTIPAATGVPQIDHVHVALTVDPATGMLISEAVQDASTGTTVVAKLEGFTAPGTGAGAGAKG